MKSSDEKPLIVLEMANNHMGDVSHGKALISALAEVVRPHRATFDFAVNINSDSWIHSFTLITEAVT